jgi:pSer/pThr/pTyr-binding forkhead associated (FHA) protein
MKVVGPEPGASRAVELQTVLRAEREGLPFLVGRDGEERQLLLVLEPGDERLWVGRGAACDVVLDWDEKVSRVHVELVRVADGWALEDGGLSRNGTFVGGERVTGRRRLHDGDLVRFGATTLTYRAPGGTGAATGLAEEMLSPTDLTPMQRKVLAALCRPLREGRGLALPATNRAIAEELVLSVEAVKTHMRALFDKFDVEDLPHNQKRTRLAELALQAGVVSDPG